MSEKRIRRTPDEARAIILETTKRVMLEEGYAAASTRRVAQVAGISARLVHYYYPKTDDLLIALYRHTSQQDLDSLLAALRSDDPVSALWGHQTQGERAALGAEFLALANHRKAIKSEIVRYTERVRELQAEMLAERVHEISKTGPCPPLCMATLMTSVSRTLIMEDAVGISLGHAETKAFVAGVLAYLGKSRPTD